MKCNVTAVQQSVKAPVLLKSKDAQVEAGTNDKQDLPRAEAPLESGKSQANQKRKREKERPQQANAARKGCTEKQDDPETFRYVCPFCQGAVTSRVRTGEVDHRSACGKRFRVCEGCVVSTAFVYGCPFCGGNVRSKLKTGQMDHRTVCGNQFYVQDGAVDKKTRQHPHNCPACGTVVWSARSAGRIRVMHNMPSGKPCNKKSWQVRDHDAAKKDAKH